MSGVAFHPHGTMLATSAGDNTVKIWDFLQVCHQFYFFSAESGQGKYGLQYYCNSWAGVQAHLKGGGGCSESESKVQETTLRITGEKNDVLSPQLVGEYRSCSPVWTEKRCGSIRFVFCGAGFALYDVLLFSG